MTHTPGPWKWVIPDESISSEEAILIGPNDIKICDFGDNEEFYPIAGHPPNSSDMILIAAAPELLEAVKAAEKLNDWIADHITTTIYEAEELKKPLMEIKAFQEMDEAMHNGLLASYRDQFAEAIEKSEVRHDRQ